METGIVVQFMYHLVGFVIGRKRSRKVPASNPQPS